jgi:hypothetical protein
VATETRDPIHSLAPAGLLLGALGETDWFLLYAGLLFGMAMLIGLRRPQRMMRWILVLAAGTPVLHLVYLLLGWTGGGPSWPVELLQRTSGALLAILPGLGAGLLYRRLSPRMKKAAV